MSRARLAVIGLVVAGVLAGCGSDRSADREPPGSRSATSSPADPGRIPHPTDTATVDGSGAGSTTSGPAPPPTAPTPPPTSTTGSPARIAIPAIGVDAAVVDLSRRPDGTLEVPGWDDAGWWRRGPAPGERGPAVIVGHVDSKRGPAVFSGLDRLRAGDEVVVALDDGGSVTYAVTDLQRVAKDEFPTTAVYGLTDGPELRLVTCDGAFDRSTGHYVDNLVVFASLVAG